MISRLAEFFERAIAHLKDLGGFRAILLALSVAGVLAAFDKLLSENESRIAHLFHVPASALYGIALAGCSAVVVAIVVMERDRITRPEAMPDPDEVFDDQLEPIDRRTPELGAAIRGTLIPQLFPSARNPAGSETMPFDEIDKAGAKNRYMAVGVYSRRDERFVGYASFWPVRDEIGIALMEGRMTDSELTADHVVPEAERHLCRYAVIPGIGVIGGSRSERVRRALILVRTLRKMIASKYLEGRRAPLTLIASAYSEHGRKWCAHYGMEESGKADYGDGVLVSVRTRSVRLKDLV